MTSDPIRVLGLDEDALVSSQDGDQIVTILLRLSAVPDDEWTRAFHLAWARTSYPRKRSVRVGAVRVLDRTEIRRGLVVSAAPADYVRIHREPIEHAVLQANDATRRTDRASARTVADAQQAIRQINAELYGGPRLARFDRPPSDDGRGSVAA